MDLPTEVATLDGAMIKVEKTADGKLLVVGLRAADSVRVVSQTCPPRHPPLSSRTPRFEPSALHGLNDVTRRGDHHIPGPVWRRGTR